MAGDHTWEPFTSVKELEALDHYFALMGVTHWQSLARKPTITMKEVFPSRTITRRKGSRHQSSPLTIVGSSANDCRDGGTSFAYRQREGESKEVSARNERIWLWPCRGQHAGYHMPNSEIAGTQTN